MIERTIRFLFPMSGGPQFGLSVRLIFRVRRGFRSSVAARVLFEMAAAAAAAAVSASSLLFAVRVRNKPDERGTLLLIHHLGHSSFLKVFLSGGLRDSHLLSADSVHSSLFPHCQCFKRRFPPPRCRRPSPMSMAASASTASQVASFVSLSVGGEKREKEQRATVK